MILGSYVRDIFNSETITGTGRVNKALGPFELPASAKFHEYFDMVNKLPEDDKPSMFGLPANIERSYQRMSSGGTINQLKTLMRSVAGGSKFEREKWNKELTPILNLWKKLNQGSSLLQMKLHPPTAGEKDPMKAFIELEFYNGVTLLQSIHKALSGLSKVIRGSALLDEKVSKLADSLLRQETPGNWNKMWDGPEDPMDYLQVIVQKSNEVQKWKSMTDQLLHQELDLSDLFNPETFLGALRQLTAREYGLPMDELRFANAWGRGTVPGASVPIKVGGLMIEGALFDGAKLSPNSHDSPTFTTVPNSTMAWVPSKGHEHHYNDNATIRVPLYYSSERDKVVAFMDLPSGGKKDTWLQSGTVLFLNTHL